MIKHFACLALLFLCTHPLWAQKGVDQQLIAKTYSQQLSSPVLPGAERVYLIRFKSRADQKNFRLLKRLSANYFIAALRDSVAGNKNISSITAANNLWKADDALAQLAQKHPSTSKQIDIVVTHQSAALLDALRSAGSIMSVHNNLISIKIPLEALPSLLARTDVKFAGLQRKAHEELVISDLDLGSNNISAIADNFAGVNGSGINISVKEEKYDLTDLDLLGRSFTSITPSQKITGHATIMATLIGGNGNSFALGLGAAPAVKFTSSSFANLLPDSIGLFKNFGISVQNHSYGTGIENFYGIEAEAYDKQIFEADTLVHVFSSGNSGTTTPVAGMYGGIANVANLSGTFKQAKNVIVVGGTNRLNIPEALSSSGPAYDGRIKPEIVAGGEDGTSGAAALTTGTVALLQQDYKKQFGKAPSAALIKSVLINSADDIGIPYVDHKTGYGKLNALEALRTITDNRIKAGTVTPNQTISYQVTVPPNCSELKVSLAWNDIAAELNAPVALINNLDLSVNSPDGRRLLPWTLSSYPDADSLALPAVRGIDSLNNTEQVTLQNPVAGIYTIQVTGANVSTALQSFYIAYQTKLINTFEWTSPSGNNQLFAAADNYLRWQSTYNNVTALLSVSYDHGTTWSKLADVNPTAGLYKWSAPHAFTQAVFKSSVSGTDYISKEFTLTRPLTLNVGYDCTSGTLLHWNAQPGATGYVVYTIKNNVLQKLSTVTDSIAVIPAALQSSKYFAVSALGNGFEGLRSFTIDATSQGVGCYTKALLAELADNKNVLLNLSLGSTIRLKTITWEKLTGTNKFTAIGTSAVTDNLLQYTFSDANPKKGISYYRATLTTTDGSSVYSDLANVTVLQSNQFALFPSPVRSQLTILTGKQEDYEIRFYDMSGKLSLTKTFNSLQNSISINLIPGTYACAISLAGKVVYSGKILKVL
ncbi:S8 family peptidase [Mucilaginibacter sp.]|uniref:S8 family peptidase n=1 Tax=Mucilaginibacter sp. TaxID=1882438 RepID=UPI0035BC0E62